MKKREASDTFVAMQINQLSLKFFNLLAALLITFLMTSMVDAKPFQNAYVRFELPDKWSCKMEGTEWICYSDTTPSTKGAIIVLTAKEVGPTDSFPSYEAHLRTPRTVPDKAGRPTISKLVHVKHVNINSHPWVDGMHFGSEIPSYYTRYLATIKDRIAILVTFSAYQAEYVRYSGDFKKAIDSLRVTDSKDLLLMRPNAGLGKSNRDSLGSQPNMLPPPETSMDTLAQESSGGNSSTYLAIIIIIAAVGAYLYLKKDDSKGKKRR